MSLIFKKRRMDPADVKPGAHQGGADVSRITLPGKVVTECHSIQQIGLAIRRMVERSGKVGENR